MMGRRIRPFWADYGWFVVGGLALLAFLLGIGGFERQPESESGWDSLYHSLQLFWLEYGPIVEPANWELDVARILAGSITLYAAVRAVMGIFAEQIHAQRARFARNHVVVCGLGRGGSLVAKGFRERGDTVVAIERDKDSGAIRECRELGAVVLVGDATERRLLRKAGVDRAAHLVLFSGDDGLNAEIAIAARELVKGRTGRPLRCYVHIVDFELRNMLEESQLAASRSDAFVPDFFNAAERGAPVLLQTHPPFAEEAPASVVAHVLVVGMGEMGANVVVQAALRWHGLRARPKLAVTVVDLEATARLTLLSRQYMRLPEVCELRPVDKDVHAPEFQTGEFLAGGPPVTAVYVCLDDDARGLSTALRLGRLPQLRGVPTVVRTTQLAGLSQLVESESDAEASPPDLRIFGVLDATCTPDALLRGTREVLARAMHEAYLSSQFSEGETWGDKPAIARWDELEERFKESNRRQADHIGMKLAAIRCNLARLTDWDEPPMTFSRGQVERLAIMEHVRWCEEKKAAGETSEYMVPWLQLPENVKEWDRKPVRELPVFLARVGYKVVR